MSGRGLGGHPEDGGDGTLTAQEAEPAPPERAPHLFLLLECDRPRAGGWRIRLDDLDELEIGRGGQRASQISGPGSAGRQTLRLSCPDRRLSAAHARLHPVLGGWELADLGSKNGCLVNGERVERARLRDGDLLELGRTLWLFRADLLHHGGPRVSPPDEPHAAADPAEAPQGAPASAPVAAEGAVAAPASAPIGAASLVPELARGFERLADVARSAAPILLVGESGTGKELLARAVHAWSGRPGPLVAVNCAALPAGLVESSLFGHRRGAFTGATDAQPGLVRAADAGTLFLDEIGDLAPQAQAVLLRVLQEKEVVPVGETRPVPVDVRIVAATHRDLERAAASGRFRADLLARLAGYRFELPPLRARREDLGLLMAAILARLGADVRLTPEAARALARRPFHLNVRELERALEAAVALAGPGGEIDADMLPLRGGDGAGGEAAGPPFPISPPDNSEELRARLVAELERQQGNVSAVARAMGKARMQVQRWIKRFRLRAEDYRR